MPESVKDRPTKSHEYIFLLSKSKKYYYDYEAILEPYTKPMNRWGGQKLKADGESDWDKGTGQTTYRTRDMRPNPKGKNRRDVWTVTPKPYRGAHYATFPPDLIEPCILAGCPEGGVVLDPFVGSGTTVMVANRNGRKGIGLDLSWKYLDENARIRTKEV
jgi:DNA modification methylase